MESQWKVENPAIKTTRRPLRYLRVQIHVEGGRRGAQTAEKGLGLRRRQPADVGAALDLGGAKSFVPVFTEKSQTAMGCFVCANANAVMLALLVAVCFTLRVTQRCS